MREGAGGRGCGSNESRSHARCCMCHHFVWFSELRTVRSSDVSLVWSYILPVQVEHVMPTCYGGGNSTWLHAESSTGPKYTTDTLHNLYWVATTSAVTATVTMLVLAATANRRGRPTGGGTPPLCGGWRGRVPLPTHARTRTHISRGGHSAATPARPPRPSLTSVQQRPRLGVCARAPPMPPALSARAWGRTPTRHAGAHTVALRRKQSP